MQFTSKDNMFYSSSKNLLDAVIDEVALEGLDGITLETLWQRLAIRLQMMGTFPQLLKEQIWSICVSVKDFTIYQLQEARPPLIIYDRYEFVDPDLETIVEPDSLPDEIYEHYPIDDVQNGIKGSCKSYYTRKAIESIRNISLESAQKNYGETLVIVASQAARQHALFGDTVCPTLILNVMQFCFLERVGRSRYHGEVTQGKRSLSILNEDPKTLFYHRKVLLKHKLITKQMHYQKNSGHGTSGSLLHLPRFYVERKPKMLYLTEKIIEILKKREDYMADYVEIKKEFGAESSLKHLFKTALFQRVIKSEYYHKLSPNHQPSQHKRKNYDQHEKKIRAIQLVDPSLDINDLLVKDEGIDDEESYELNTFDQKINEPFLRQANRIVERASCNGLSQAELARQMGLTKLQSRTIFRNLSRIELVANYMDDIGRQRITKYVSKKFEKNSSISMQFQTEMVKMKELTKKSSLENVCKQPSIVKELFYPSTKCVGEELDSEIQMNEKSMRIENEQQQTDSKNLFSHVNRILKKYKLNKFGLKYSVTYLNIVKMNDLLMHLRRSRQKILNISQKYKSSLESNSTSEKKCNDTLQETKMLDESVSDIQCSIKEMSLSDIKNTGVVTYRILKRANMIIEAVKEHQVIDDTNKLMKMINEEEEQEGYDVKIDKKSLIRLLQKLASDNLVKNMKLTLSANGMKKILTFVCDPSININHTVIQSAVEQAKIKFCLMNENKRKLSSKANNDSNNDKVPISKLPIKLQAHENCKIIPSNVIINAKAGKDYGYSPKFIRMKVIHQLLYYLIYDHPEHLNSSRTYQIQELDAQGHQIDDAMKKEMSKLFSTQISWKMFIPPLPNHKGWSNGWALFCDILLRLPLSMFLKVHNVQFIIPDLDYYIKHPIRQHYLVKDLPAPLRNILMMKRRYIFSVHETITRLCFIGLIQFGPQKLKDKDQVFIYLNRRSQLMDTTTSAAGYHIIQEKEYPITNYYFEKMQTVEKYWYDMWHICINTQLGGRLAVQGTDIILEELTKKIAMVETLKPKTATEAASFDLGIMPGDKKGAAGIDSAFFSHLKRNWNWDNFNNSYNISTNNNEMRYDMSLRKIKHEPKMQTEPIKYKEFTGLRKVMGPTPININNLKEVKKAKQKLSNSPDKLTRIKLVSNNKGSRKQSTIVRRVLPRKQKARRRVKYDDIDYSALQKMEKLRVDWSPREDNILLVCKVVMMYLAPNPRISVITFTAVRDVLRSYSLSSYNKTSRACQRRLLYMLKQPQTIRSVILGVEEMKQNYFVNKKYGDVVAKIRRANDSSDCDEKMAAVFKNLVAYVAKKYYDISQTESKSVKYKPNTVQEFNLIYEVNHPQKSQINQGFTHDVKSINDIHTATINSVIYSSMSCGKDRKSWAYQLFRIYQQYPEILLRNAIAKIRSDQMVSIKRNYVTAMKKYGNCMPMSSSQYQLSTAYIHKFQTKLPIEIYSEIEDFFSKIIGAYVNENSKDIRSNGIQVSPPTGGMIVGIQECFAQNKLNFDVEIPDHVITLLNPKVQEHDETYIRIAKRYQDILASLEQNHTDHEDLMNNENAEASLPISNKICDDIKVSTEVNARNSKINPESDTAPIKQTAKKSTLKREHWGWGLSKHNHQSDESIQENDFNWDCDKTENEIDCNYVKLQDDVTIEINDEDIQRSRLTVIDNHIYEAFSKTHTHLDTDFVDFSSTKILNEMVNDSSITYSKVDSKERPVLQFEPQKKTYEHHERDSITANKQRNSNFINDIIANMECEIESISSRREKNVNTDDAHKSCTRIALLKMREELNEDLLDSHHAHEYFAVSTFDIYYSLSESDIERCKNISPIDNEKIFNEILSSNDDNFRQVDSDLKKFGVFPKNFPDVLRIIFDLEQHENIAKKDINSILEYVREKRERGATLNELKIMFYHKIGKKLYDILHHMMNYRLFLRSGVTQMHYIHHSFIDPWIIRSIRIMRLQREGLPTLPPGAVYILNSQHTESIPSKNDTETVVNIKEDKNVSQNLNESDPIRIPNNRKTIRKNRRTCLLQTKDIYSAAKKLDLNTAEDIHVVIRPWIQIDGVINRSMLEKMLGAVLAHCVMNPGITLTQVQSRFVPALQPYHTRELVEMLVKLECLRFQVMSKITTNLFTISSSTRLNYPAQADGSSASDHELIVEVTMNATLKLSTFLRRYRK